MAPYLDQQSDTAWMQKGCGLLQMTSTGQRCGVAQFESEYLDQARYCRDHTLSLGEGERFFILPPVRERSVVFPLLEGERAELDGREAEMTWNSQWNCWTIRFFW